MVRERYPMVLIRDGKEEHYHSLLYVKTISIISLSLPVSGYLRKPLLSPSTLKIGTCGLISDGPHFGLAPHPDDEVLGAAGVIQQAVAMKLPIKIVFLTYGDSNQWSFLLYRKHPVVFPGAVENMGFVRHDEAINASGILGVAPQNLIFLGYPDFGTLNIWYYHWNQRPAYRSLMTRVTAVPYKSAYRFGARIRGKKSSRTSGLF